MRHSARVSACSRRRYPCFSAGWRERPLSTLIEALPRREAARWLSGPRTGWPRYAAGVLALAAAYYAAAKAGQALPYTASVSAIGPPAGLGIAALYLWGLRWWPGIFLGDLIINLELLVGHHSLPAAALVGQQVGNMAEILVGAALMRRLIGRRAELDRVEQVTGMLAALAAGDGDQRRGRHALDA